MSPQYEYHVSEPGFPMIDIDTPDFDQAMNGSSDGTFQKAVLEYLDLAQRDVIAQVDRGLSPLEFGEAQKIATAIEKAGDVIRFSQRTS